MIYSFSLFLLAVVGASAIGERPTPFETQTWCDPVLGCLELTDDWWSPNRPFNVLPEDRASINTRFMLHTRDAPFINSDYFISADNPSTIDASTFNPNRTTLFITHGFIDTGFKKWLYDMAEAMLNYGDYNVIRVDWGDGSLPLYMQASANIRVVGLEIGHLVNTLKANYGLKTAKVHLIGHSLGSHASGYAGEQIEGLGRITGMDPAGPYFTGTASYIRLDPTDAELVEAIHTDAQSIFLLGYGTKQPLGHMDFYPNDGFNQPGCDPVTIAIDAITGEMIDAGRDLVACSHQRAVDFFQESMQSPSCNWLAHKCFNYETFKNGQCGDCEADNSNCAFQGIQAEEYVNPTAINQMFYLDTDSTSPFCIQHYRVRLLTGNPSEAEIWVMGKLMLSLYGSKGTITLEQVTSNHERIDHGQVYDTLFTQKTDVGDIMMVDIKWVYDDQIFNPGTYCWGLICNRSLYVLSIEIEPISYFPNSEQEASSVLACLQDGSVLKIKDGKTESVVPSSNCVVVES